MEIDVAEGGLIRLTKVYNPVIIVTESGTFSVCERDGSLEVVDWKRKITTSYPVADPERTTPLPGMVGFGQVGVVDHVAVHNKMKKDKLTDVAYCGFCRHDMTLVRPGKHQCDNPKCDLGGQRKIL